MTLSSNSQRYHSSWPRLRQKCWQFSWSSRLIYISTALAGWTPGDGNLWATLGIHSFAVFSKRQQYEFILMVNIAFSSQTSSVPDCAIGIALTTLASNHRDGRPSVLNNMPGAYTEQIGENKVPRKKIKNCLKWPWTLWFRISGRMHVKHWTWDRFLPRMSQGIKILPCGLNWWKRIFNKQFLLPE